MTNIKYHQTASIGTIYIDSVSGDSFFTRSSLASACGVHPTIVTRSLQRGHISGEIKAEAITDGGLQGVTLLPCKEPSVFEFIIKHNPKLGASMGTMGATVYLHNLAGFKVSSEGASKFNETVEEMFNPYREVMTQYDRIISDNHGAIYDDYYKAYFGMSVSEYKTTYGVDNGSELSFLPDTAPKDTWLLHKVLRGVLAGTRPKATRAATIKAALAKLPKELKKVGLS